jgi:hypothetical protein
MRASGTFQKEGKVASQIPRYRAGQPHSRPSSRAWPGSLRSGPVGLATLGTIARTGRNNKCRSAQGREKISGRDGFLLAFARGKALWEPLEWRAGKQNTAAEASHETACSFSSADPGIPTDSSGRKSLPAGHALGNRKSVHGGVGHSLERRQPQHAADAQRAGTGAWADREWAVWRPSSGEFPCPNINAYLRFLLRPKSLPESLIAR